MLSIETCQNLSRDPVACADRLGSARSNHGQRPFHCPCRSTSRGMGIWILGAAISSNKDNKLGWLTKQLRLAKNRSWTNQTRIAELERPVMLTHGRWRRFALMQLEQSSKGFSWHTHNIDNCWMQLFPICIVFCLWWCFAMYWMMPASLLSSFNKCCDVQLSSTDRVIRVYFILHSC